MLGKILIENNEQFMFVACLLNVTERKERLAINLQMAGETRPCRGSRVESMPYISGMSNGGQVLRRVEEGNRDR